MTGVGWLLIHLTLAKMAPLLLAAIGGLASERAGVINIALEGMMLAGAFGAAVGAVLTGSAWLGLICGALCACLLAALHGLACIRLRVDQIVSGTAVNLLSLGATGFLLYRIFGTHGSSPSAPKLPTVNLVPFLGGPFRQPVTVLIAIVLAFAAWYIIYQTPFGLRLRAPLPGRLEPICGTDDGGPWFHRAGRPHLRQVAPAGRAWGLPVLRPGRGDRRRSAGLDRTAALSILSGAAVRPHTGRARGLRRPVETAGGAGEDGSVISIQLSVVGGQLGQTAAASGWQTTGGFLRKRSSGSAEAWCPGMSAHTPV